MAATNHIQIIGEFIDKISPGLAQVGNNVGVLQAAFAGFAGGLAGGAAVAIVEKLGEAIADVTTIIPKLTLEAIAAADELDDMAQKTGIAVDELQRLKLAASMEDVDDKSLAGAIRKLNKSISEAAGDETSKAALLFKELGIDIKDSEGKVITADKAMRGMADAYKTMADSADKSQTTMDLGGKQLVELIPLLNKGSEELDKWAKIQVGMDLGFNQEQMDQADAYGKAIKLIKTAFEGIGAVIAKELLPGLSTTAEYFAEGAKEGGTLNLVIKAIGETIAFLLKFVSPLIYGFATLTAMIKATAVQLAGLAAAATFALKWDFTGAKAALKEMEADTQKIYEDLAKFIDKSQNPEKYKEPEAAPRTGTAPNGDALVARQKALEEARKAAEKLNDEYEKALNKLRKELALTDESGRTAQIAADIKDGAYKKFSKAQQENLLSLGRQIDLQKQTVALAKQELDAQQALEKKSAVQKINTESLNYGDPAARAGFLAAKQQEFEMNDKLDAQKAEALRNKDPEVQANLLKEIELSRQKFAINGELYNLALKSGAEDFNRAQAAKVYLETVTSVNDAIRFGIIAQEQYGQMLKDGAIEQDRYNQLMTDAVRKQEDLNYALDGTNKAFTAIIGNRRGMEDVVKSMSALQNAKEAGKVSAAEYAKSMYDLQQSYDNLNPTFAINMVDKMQGIMKSAAASFEGMFSDTIFDAVNGKWNDLGKNIENIITRMVANMLAAQLQMAIFGDMGSTPSGKTSSSTGLLGSLLSMFGGFRANGGPVTAGMSYIVGEKRPELFTPTVDGTISPSVNQAPININITAMDTQSINQALTKDTRFLATLVSGAQKAYGIR